MSEALTYWDFEESPWEQKPLTLADVPDDPSKMYVVEYNDGTLHVRCRVNGRTANNRGYFTGQPSDYSIIQGVGFDLPDNTPKTLAEVPERRLCRLGGLSALYWHCDEVVCLIRGDGTIDECRDQWHMYHKHRVETVLPFVAVLKTKGGAK